MDSIWPLSHTANFEGALVDLRDVFCAIDKLNFAFIPKNVTCSDKRYPSWVVITVVVSTDSVKMSTVRDWPVSRNIGELRRILGLSSYYRWFVKDFATNP